MTETDILRRQEINGQTEFYLMKSGRFFQSFGNGAFALSRATGYRVLLRNRKHGQVYVCGFPETSLPGVRASIFRHNGTIREIDPGTLIFYGIDGTPDRALVTARSDSTPAVSSSSESGSQSDSDELRKELMSFDLSSATAIDAMFFLNRLQRKYGAQ